MDTKNQTWPSDVINYKSIAICGTEIFYREAGDGSKPNLLLLHGYPSSSHMFRNIIPKLSEHFHIVAPDLPAFGFSEAPARDNFEYTFENFSNIMTCFLAALGITKTSFYLFDYGAPIIMRLIVNNPSCAEMLIFQNGTIHMEGLGNGLKNTMELFKNKNEENLEKLAKLVGPEYIQWEYTTGVQDPTKITSDTYSLDQMLMERKGLKKIHLAIKEDYKNNLPLYKTWQETLFKLQPPTLIVWGENDQVFTKEGALAIHNEMKESKLVFYPTGHFALEEFGAEITQEILEYHQSILSK
ncbi:alpha/beta hydrolase [Flavobacterium aquidurense]|uniref:alpha/beta fold hydrolase n=1 Tax=Flavobacterium aquidurense TaxID=362413 RepID=UPI0028578B92|nr:alpha/beta hydrolase [Flavobacterium aquidurense]MDR7369989.1 pimeloyl-ACP methyl ester carboxylesterase [Flavobacterium aquidurense]